jgi:serine/threonine-protein phosphatase 5
MLRQSVCRFNYYKTLLKKVNENRQLSSGEISDVLDSVQSVLNTVPAIPKLNVPLLRVCGDVHGQFEDMKRIFASNGFPARDNPYLFNGDFVDRGPNSTACILTLLLHKLIDPDSMFLNRGNHELPEMNAYYGFRKELKNDTLWVQFNKVFEQLPIAHIVNDEFFVVHGGLPKEAVNVHDFNSDETIVAEFLWNDPCDKDGIHPNPRGPGVVRFGPDITHKFLKHNGLKTVIRSHEMVHEGFKWSQNNQCLTVFSAPYYAGHFKNKGGVVLIKRMADQSNTIECRAFDSHSVISKL